MLNTRVTIILIEEQAWSISKRYEIPRKICITIYENLIFSQDGLVAVLSKWNAESITSIQTNVPLTEHI